MGVDIETWVKVIKDHPAKYRFRGLRGEGDRHANGWFTDVREAAVHDEQFMEKWMEDERKSLLEELDHELKMDPPKEGDEDQPQVESYAEFLRGRFWSKWGEPENINKAPARKVIDKLEPKEPIPQKFREAISKDNLRFEWSLEAAEPDWAWETIRGQEPDYILKDHPPTHMLDHASEDAVPLEDVYFVCPSCHQQPVTQDQVAHGHFYCGLCGASDALAEGEPFGNFIAALGIKLWPFREVPP